MDLEKIFYEIVSECKKPQGVFILRNGLMVPMKNMIYWDWGFPKWEFLQCRINVIYDNKVVNLLYYPNEFIHHYKEEPLNPTYKYLRIDINDINNMIDYIDKFKELNSEDLEDLANKINEHNLEDLVENNTREYIVNVTDEIK